MNKSKYTFTWKIENFSFCHHNNGVLLYGPEFHIKNFKTLTGYLNLYPRGESNEYSDFISCSLELVADDPIDSLQCEIEAIGSSEKILKNYKWNTIVTNETELKFPDFLAIKDYVQDAEDCAEDTLTIRCKLHGDISTEIGTEEDFCCTKIGVNRNTFEMSVPREETTKHLLTSESNNNFEISITEKNNNFKIIFTRVIAETDYKEPCIVDCTLTLINIYHSEIYSERKKHYFSSENCSKLEFPSEAISKERENHLNFSDDCFQSFTEFYCEFSVSNGTHLHTNMPTSISSSIPNKSSSTSASPSLQEDLRSLFHNKHLSDVKLRVDGETLEAHKNILVARSPVFAVMFDHQDMAESRSGIVDIVDIDAHIMKSFLEFLYTDGVDEMDYEIAAKLLMAAEKYQILLLKEKCAMFLKNEMSEENVCEILSLADAVNHEFLKSASFEYIIAKSATILSSPQWIPWIKNNMELATAIFAKLTLSQTSSKN